MSQKSGEARTYYGWPMLVTDSAKTHIIPVDIQIFYTGSGATWELRNLLI
jgi:hypothetical protein